jgi:hypothetical protein
MGLRRRQLVGPRWADVDLDRAPSRGHSPCRVGAERAAVAEIWQDHDLVVPSERGTPIEPTNLSRTFARTLKVYAHANLDAVRHALGKLDGRLL